MTGAVKSCPPSSRFARTVADLRAQGFDECQVGAQVLLAVLRRKHELVAGGRNLDGSWQASVAWIAAQLEGEPLRERVLNAIFAVMNASAHSVELARSREAIFSLCANIRASGRHRRDQIIVRLVRECPDSGYVEERSGAIRVVVPVIGEAAGAANANSFVFAARPLNARARALKQGLLRLGEAGRACIPWHQSRDIETLFRRLEVAVLTNEDIQEITFGWANEAEQRVAGTLARSLAALWNVPSFADGEPDFVYWEAARSAAARIARTPA